MGAEAVSELSDSSLAAALLAVDPVGLGGILLRARCGHDRDAWVDDLRRMLPAAMPVRRLPLHCDVDRLIGGLDLVATLQAGRPVLERGLLAACDGGVLLIPSAERLARETGGLLAATMDLGEIRIERDGFAARLPAQFAVVALDEGYEECEATPPALADRLAFHIELRDGDPNDLASAERIGRAREAEMPACSGAIESALCKAALTLGIGSLRAPLFALRAARALCRLEHRAVVTERDAARAARLVLAPRAVSFPAEDQPPDEGGERQSQDDAGDTGAPGSADQVADVVLQAVRPALPPGLLAALGGQAGARIGRDVGSTSQAKARQARRGRPAGTRRGDPRRGDRLDLVATLRAAAPWQRLRRTERNAALAVTVYRDDLRVTRRRPRTETTAIFAVDASGSAALHRLGEAKGAIELILAQCYVRRDRAALVAFRGRAAEVLLPPTRSLERARRCLAGLPGGGGTPLSAGIDASLGIAEQVRRGGGAPVLVILTDGRANIARDGTAGRAAAERDALASARAVRAGGFRALLIDVAPQPHPAARGLADAMDARYLPLPLADASRLSGAILDAMSQERAR